MRTIAISGSFDPIHSGHIALFKGAARMGRVICILKGDMRLTRKKGKCLMSAKERAEILQAIRYIDEVIIYDNSDKHPDDFSEALEKVRPEIYAAGGDKISEHDVPEIKSTCDRLGIEIVYRIGGDKINSSSLLLKNWSGHENKNSH